MFDIGIFKIPFAVASLVLVATSMLTGQCTEYWQFILCQGVALGVSLRFIEVRVTRLILFSVGMWYFIWTVYGNHRSLVQEGILVLFSYSESMLIQCIQKRGLALGINACGSSLGGTLIPIATRRLLVEVG